MIRAKGTKLQRNIGSDSVNENLLCVKEGMWVISVQNHSKISKNGGYVGASNLILHTVNCELIHSSTPWTSGERSTPMEICTPRSHLWISTPLCAANVTLQCNIKRISSACWYWDGDERTRGAGQQRMSPARGCRRQTRFCSARSHTLWPRLAVNGDATAIKLRHQIRRPNGGISDTMRAWKPNNGYNHAMDTNPQVKFEIHVVF